MVSQTEEEIASSSQEKSETESPPPELEAEDIFHDTSTEFGPEPVDWEDDPLETRESTGEPAEWDHEFFAQFTAREPSAPNDDSIRKGIRDLLEEIEAGPPKGDDQKLEEQLTEWLRSVKDKVHQVESFVAGNFGRHVAAWEELLSSSTRPASRSVLSWIRNGIKPSFAGTSQCDPHKLERVKRMLRKVVGPTRVEEWLAGQVPHPVEFPNHRSFFENSAFAIEAVGEMLVNSTVRLYEVGERRPKVVNPLGVANLPKGRLVLDAGYVNSFTKHIPFKYETLREILSFLDSQGFFSTWDFKAGYYHVLIHPRFRTYFGFRIGKAYFHYNAMCFRWSEACFAYTLVTQEAAKELRLRGIPMSSYLDDGLTGDKLRLRCLWAIIMIIRFLTFLGAVFSLSKCKFWPTQTGDWLGFVVDTTREQFRVSEAKQEKVRTTLNELIEAETVTPRLLAKVAGRIIAMGPAVLPAALYSRPLFQAIQGKLSWDQIFPDSGSGQGDSPLIHRETRGVERAQVVPQTSPAGGSVRCIGLWLRRHNSSSGEALLRACGLPLRIRGPDVQHCKRDAGLPKSPSASHGKLPGAPARIGHPGDRGQPRGGIRLEQVQQPCCRRRLKFARNLRALLHSGLRRGGPVEATGGARPRGRSQ
jgi:hypothetical protein